MRLRISKRLQPALAKSSHSPSNIGKVDQHVAATIGVGALESRFGLRTVHKARDRLLFLT